MGTDVPSERASKRAWMDLLSRGGFAFVRTASQPRVSSAGYCLSRPVIVSCVLGTQRFPCGSLGGGDFRPREGGLV